MKNILIILGLVAVVVLASGGITKIEDRFKSNGNKGPGGGPIACIQDAKLCDDGSYVSRTGPNCEFALCPESPAPIATNTGVLRGHMSIGPLCPVERVDNPCLPTPEMYASKIIHIYRADKITLVKNISPDANGNYSTSLGVGTYYVNVDRDNQSVGGIDGVPATIRVENGKSVTMNINIDTGIR